MPAFRFEAAAAEGRIEQGLLDADSARHARGLLRDRGLVPILVEPVAVSSGGPAAATGGNGRAASRAGLTAPARRISTAELALLTRQIASLLQAGLPLERALSAVIDQAEKVAVRERLAAVRAEVLSGSGLAEALRQWPRDFPDIYRALVAAGEHSGDLSTVMGRLADYIEQRNALTQKVVLAFTYPAIVTAVALLVITGLLAYVVPQVVGVFEQSRQALPWLTRALIAVSHAVREWGWLAVLLGVAFGWLARRALQDEALRLRWHQTLLTWPIAGPLVRGVNTARFASTLAILVGAGVPLLRAMEAGAQTLGNDALRANVTDAMQRVREGSSLGRALAAQGRFPSVLVHLIASGEQSGRLAEMLERAAQGQSQELERRTVMLTSLLEPVLVLTMGVIVLLIVLAVLLPIIEINQLVR